MFVPMIVLTDNLQYGKDIVGIKGNFKPSVSAELDPKLHPLVKEIFGLKPVSRTSWMNESRWTYAFLVKRALISNYDLFIHLLRKKIYLPDRSLCLIGSGEGFHGQKGRPWEALAGNLHLVIHLTPHQDLEHLGACFSVLNAVSIVQALDEFTEIERQASIKWVNDVYINDAKVAGFLVHTSSIDESVTAAILGIGLNVEKAPHFINTPAVPRMAALSSFAQDKKIISQGRVLKKLLSKIEKNYALLLSGHYTQLLEFYRKRSMVIGRNVKIIQDSLEEEHRTISEGIVQDIGDDLELYIKGKKKAVSQGRIIMEG